MVNAKLIVVGGDAKAAEIQLKLPTVIGRGKEAGLTIPHALVSRRHTEIFEREGKLFVKDLGSLNGTFVNNLRIEDEQPLEPDQLLTLGNVTFRAFYEIQSSDRAPAGDTEAISFAHHDTDSLEPICESQPEKVEVSTGSEPAEPQMDLDETVPLDSLPSHDQAESKPDGLVEPEPKTVQASDKDENSDFKSGSKNLAADTDSCFTTTDESESKSESNVFSFEDEKGSAEKSVSISGLDDLASGQPAISSISGRLELGDDQKEPVSKIDPNEFELGSEGEKPPVAEDSSLGSFLRKLPR